MDVAATRLLAWYDRHRRTLPWRAASGETADPYRVWLSEVMLQQTTVVTVAPYFARFLARWPTVAALAAAPLDDVLTEWAGLGYYARARNLHRCAAVVAGQLGGRFPDHEEGLAELPGIGAYTAAAIAAIAFDRPATVVDGNVERVIARYFAVTTPFPDAKPEVRRLAAALTPTARPGDFAQAMMDLGATVCTPRNAFCMTCPLQADCRARAEGMTEHLPAKRAKAARPERVGVAFWLEDAAGRVLMERRPDSGLLGGMIGLPGTPWRPGVPWGNGETRALAPVAGVDWVTVPGDVRHVFTHFALSLTVWRGQLPATGGAVADPSHFWVPTGELKRHALPTVMKKAAAHATAHA